jgi:penicillin-binding protein-related factor A (putative recombinase)
VGVFFGDLVLFDQTLQKIIFPLAGIEPQTIKFCKKLSPLLGIEL